MRCFVGRDRADGLEEVAEGHHEGVAEAMIVGAVLNFFCKYVSEVDGAVDVEDGGDPASGNLTDLRLAEVDVLGAFVGEEDLLYDYHPEKRLLQVILIQACLELALVDGHLETVDGVLELADVEVHLAQHQEHAVVRLLHQVAGDDVGAEGIAFLVLLSLILTVLPLLFSRCIHVNGADEALNDLLECPLELRVFLMGHQVLLRVVEEAARAPAA